MNAVDKLLLCRTLIYARNNINSTASEIVERHENVHPVYAKLLNDEIDYFNNEFEERIFDDSNSIDALIHSAYKRAYASVCKEDCKKIFGDDLFEKMFQYESKRFDSDLELYSQILSAEEYLEEDSNLSASEMLELVKEFKKFFIRHCHKDDKENLNEYEKGWKESASERRRKLEAKLKKSSYVHLINRSNANTQAENIEENQDNIEQNMNAPS